MGITRARACVASGGTLRAFAYPVARNSMTMATTLTFGDLLRQHRLAAGLTQEALAELAGLSEHGVQKLERGVTHPYRDTLQRLLGALKLSVDEQAQLRTAALATPRVRRILGAAEAA